LELNPHGSILFLWNALERQVRIEGGCRRRRAKSPAIFCKASPRSQIGAWISRQSSILPDGCSLEASAAALEKKFSGREIQCPDFWGGYRLVPESFEFWQERPYVFMTGSSTKRTGNMDYKPAVSVKELREFV